MNPVKLKFRHGGEMLVSPIGLRFVPDPDLGTLVLIPDAQGPKGYQLDMTLEEAEQAFRSDQTQVDALTKKVYWLQEQLEKAEKGWTTHEERLNRIEPVLHQHYDRWQALRIHLGLPEGWEHLNEGAAEVKGALVSQAEQLDSVKAHVDALYSELGLNSRWEGEKLVSYRDTNSILTEVVLMQGEVSRLTEESSLFTVAERVGELEEAHRRLRERTEKLEVVSVSSLLDDNERIRRWVLDESLRNSEALSRIERLESWKNEVHPDLAQDRDTAFPSLDDRTCVQRQTTGPIEITWTQAGPCSAATGQPIDCSSWRAPEKLGEQKRRPEGWVPSKNWEDDCAQGLTGGTNYKGRAEKAPQDFEKPKSAWRPLGFMCIGDEGIYLVRDPQNSSEIFLARKRSGYDAYFHGVEARRVPTCFHYCPIPE